MHDDQTFSSPFAQEVGMINLRAKPTKRFFTDPALLWIVPGRVCMLAGSFSDVARSVRSDADDFSDSKQFIRYTAQSFETPHHSRKIGVCISHLRISYNDKG